MKPAQTSRLALAITFATLLSTGCATLRPDESIAQVNRDAQAFTRGDLSLVTREAQRLQSQATVDTMLSQPLGQDEAVRIALLNSAALQALLATRSAEQLQAQQSGRIGNPVLTLERLRSASEIELGRMIAFGLLDLITLPQRQGTAALRMGQNRLRTTAEVVEQVTRIRQAWVTAVADAQRSLYAQQVHDSAEASAELARRMLAAGNFNKLQRARQHAFYADAAAQWAAANHAATASREALVRLLGLNDAQATRLRLPDRLPDLPPSPQAADQVAIEASTTRLDLQMAKLELDVEAGARGLARLSSRLDVELSLIDNVSKSRGDGSRTHSRGGEIAVRLPLFDWGELQRDAANMRVLSAARRVESVATAAGSQLREAYSAYRTSYDIARHYRDEIVPLRKLISDENLLRYNGMLIGVFELLADSRDQIASVSAAIDAQRQFWLAEASLRATVIGHPLTPPSGINGAGVGVGSSGGSNEAH